MVRRRQIPGNLIPQYRPIPACPFRDLMIVQPSSERSRKANSRSLHLRMCRCSSPVTKSHSPLKQLSQATSSIAPSGRHSFRCRSSISTKGRTKKFPVNSGEKVTFRNPGSNNHSTLQKADCPEWHLDKDFHWDPERVQQQSPGREPWESIQRKDSALKGWRRLCRPFRADFPNAYDPRAHALGFAATPLRGLIT